MAEPMSRRAPALLAGLSGALFLTIWASPRYVAGLTPFITGSGRTEFHGLGWVYLAVTIAATAVALFTLRWWPYQLAVAGLLTVPGVLAESVGVTFPLSVAVIAQAGYPVAVVGTLACAQALARGATGLAAAIAGLSVGALLVGSMLVGATWIRLDDTIPRWHVVMLVTGFAALVPALPLRWRGDPDAAGSAGRWSRRRIRLVLAGTLATCVGIPLSLLSTERLASLLGVSLSALYRHRYAEVAILGAIALVAGAVLAAMAGLWSLGGALTSATVQVAVAAPTILVLSGLAYEESTRWAGGLAGVALGAFAAASRWRVPLAAALAVLAATVLFIAHGATGGHPEKLAEQLRVVPNLLILVLVAATATAVVGATAPILAPRDALPATAGPLAALLTAGGLQTVQVTYLRDGLPESSYLNPVHHLTTSAVLLLVAGAAIGGLGFAHLLASRRAERKQAEQIRREAAAAERDRLARPIHDGVLQVLAMVQRQGAESGDRDSQLATLAAEQEVALRRLLSGAVDPPGGPRQDLRLRLQALASPAVAVAAPADTVLLSARTVVELTAAVQAALDNVRRHAGPGAQTWILLEDEGDGVRVSIRDDGVGFPPERLAEAADTGRLGVAQSMRGRIADLGGTTAIHSRPGEGTEVEFWVPR
jgi:signal transduction histidine kinase